MIKIIIAFIAFIGISAAVAQTLQSGAGNAVIQGSNITLPAGNSTTPSLSWGDLSTGFYRNASQQITVVAAGANIASFINALFRMTSGMDLCWGSGDSTSTCDTSLSRHATPGVVDIGTGAALSTAGGLQTGNATLLSLTTGTNADFLCLNAGGGILIQNAACTISSLRFKPDWKPYTDNALTKIAALDVGTFHLQTGTNADPNAVSLQAGLNAESVAAISPECAIYENDMKTPKSYRQECVIALLVKAIQQLKEK